MVTFFPAHIGHRTQEWSDDKKTEEIFTAKAHQIAEVRAILEKFDGSISFAERQSICSGGLDWTKRFFCTLNTKMA